MNDFKTDTQLLNSKQEDTMPDSNRKKLSQEALVSWLFLGGSLMFVVDAILENIQGVSFSSLLHLLAGILFGAGSLLFMPNDSVS